MRLRLAPTTVRLPTPSRHAACPCTRARIARLGLYTVLALLATLIPLRHPDTSMPWLPFLLVVGLLVMEIRRCRRVG